MRAIIHTHFSAISDRHTQTPLTFPPEQPGPGDLAAPCLVVGPVVPTHETMGRGPSGPGQGQHMARASGLALTAAESSRGSRSHAEPCCQRGGGRQGCPETPLSGEMPTDPSPRSPPREGTPLYAAGDGQARARGTSTLTSLCQSPFFEAPTLPRGRRPGAPTSASRGTSFPLLPAKLSRPDCAPSPPAGAPPPHAEQGQAGAKRVPGPGTASTRGQPPALGGARPAGYKASARWSLRLLLAQSISARRSPGARRARASRRGRTHLPAATCAWREPRGKLCGPRGRGGRRRPRVPGHSPPPSPARPLTFHGGEQRQQQQRGPQPPQGHGCASRGLGPRRRGARAARAGARAPGSGGQGERRGAAHTQPPPQRSQQNEPSSPGRTGTRAPPALGMAHLSRGRGGSPAEPPPPTRTRDPSRPRVPPDSWLLASSGAPAGSAGAGARRPCVPGRRRHRAPPSQQWSLPALWLLQIKQRFQPKCF